MKYEYYEKRINVKTKGRCDITPLFMDPVVFDNLIKDLVKPFSRLRYNKVVCLDALGFVLGSAVSMKKKKGLVLVRKGGKFPSFEKDKVGIYFVDYTKKRKRFEMKKDSIKKGDRILIVDEWIETGTQMESTIKLIEKLGGKVVGISVLHADKNKRIKIFLERYNLKTIDKIK